MATFSRILGNYFWIVSSRRLEDRIRDLCRKALIAENGEMKTTFAELKSALHEHTARLRNVAVMKLTRKQGPLPKERRSADPH